MTGEVPFVEEFRARAAAWLKEHAEPRVEASSAWGTGSDDVSVFHDLTDNEERDLLDRLMAWQRLKFDAGFGAITWPIEHGGAGLTTDHLDAFAEEEAGFDTPPGHETFSVTNRLVAPTIAAFGTAEQKERFIRPFLRTEVLCCQLFSEPGAGSDLAGLSTSAVRDGDEWVINGQKVWSSGARFARWGELVCRTDSTVPKHAGLTAFLLPLDAPGVEVRPIRQMSGGASFNEVFLTDVRVPDSLRLGEVGDGWNVALTTLAFERAASGTARSSERGGSWEQVRALATWAGVTGDVVVRQQLARLHTLDRIRTLNGERVAAEATPGAPPGPLHSTAKLQWTQWMNAVSDAVSAILGPRLVADTGEWGTFAWAKHVLGAPGYRIAGGSDEIQRNIIGERVLGLPAEPRLDRGVPFNELRR
ncbi:MAG: acyl-CoA dehydrogenase family protein [Acidimicrobiales bacterium]